MTRRTLVLTAALAVAVLAVALSLGRAGGPSTIEGRAQAIAAGLRCPVCQNLSVADSPSRLAGEMRAEIEDRLRAGATDEQVRAYFVDRYGDWVLLEPTRRGLNLVPWLFPAVAVVAGVAVWVALVRRRPAEVVPTAAPGDPS
jgi:cytochrome c-type biogenesis protein CcmH